MPRHPVADQIYRLVGSRVREHRERLEMTQTELARRMSASRTSISNLEAGRQHVPLHQLFALSRALDVELPILLPTAADLASLERVQRSVGGVVKEVPVGLERTISEWLAGAEEEVRNG